MPLHQLINKSLSPAPGPGERRIFRMLSVVVTVAPFLATVVLVLWTCTAAAGPAEHWAFRPPAEHTAPDVRRSDLVRTPVDRFIFAQLEREGLEPAPLADKRTLLRRVTYDLIGLPPTAAEVDAFLADDSPRAYATIVERLLASPHYGERWGRYWLDAARYADTKGYIYEGREDR